MVPELRICGLATLAAASTSNGKLSRSSLLSSISVSVVAAPMAT